MSDIKLKPCPLCNSSNLYITLSPEQSDGSRFYYAACYDCQGDGNPAATEEQAAEAWNALPRRLQWTTKTPTEPVWYWYRLTNGESRGDIVRLYDAWWDGRLCVYNRLEKPILLRDFHNGNVEWAGPIPYPQEAK